MPWRLLTRAGHEVVFATEAGGARPACDPLFLTGVIFGQLGADPEPKAFYAELEEDPAFSDPIPWSAIEPSDFDALVLPGGHAPGMKQYLGSAELQAKVAAFAALGRPVGAICHGVIVLARATDPESGKSALYKKRTPCLPKYMERTAYFLTAWKPPLGSCLQINQAKDRIELSTNPLSLDLNNGLTVVVTLDRALIPAPSSVRGHPP